MHKYYVFDDQQTAVNAELYIRQIAEFPRVGTDVNGIEKPNAQKTEKWADVQQRLDGKFVFPIVPEEIEVKYPQEVRDDFNSSFPHEIEDYDINWFAAENVD